MEEKKPRPTSAKRTSARCVITFIRDNGCERAANVLFNKVAIRFDPWDGQSHVKPISAAVIPVPDNQIIGSTPSLVTWRTASFISTLKKAEACGQLVDVVHYHPCGMTSFLMQDDTNEPEPVHLAQPARQSALARLLAEGSAIRAGRVQAE